MLKGPLNNSDRHLPTLTETAVVRFFVGVREPEGNLS
jgi:hypothetical protein